MDELEKVEKLREKTNASYEEAKQALTDANGDILDAMIILESQGKTVKGEQTTKSTTYEEQKDYVSVVETVENQDKKRDKKYDRPLGEKIKHLCHLIWIKCKDNKFVVDHNDERIISIPVWVLLIALIFSFWTVGVVLIVGLFFNCRYAIKGPDDASVINNVMDKAGDVVDKVKDEFEKN